MNLEAEIVAAEKRIRPYIRETPVEDSPSLSQSADCRALLKLENYQVTGSFKIRGALSKMLSLTPEAREHGVIAASSGNHGAALAYAREILDCQGLIAVPESASPAKVEAIRARGAEVVTCGGDAILAERWAREEAAQRGVPYVSPYNDLQVVAGQGTVGVELDRQLEKIDTVYVAVGGGGLISGTACWLKAKRPEVEIVGCSPSNSAVLHESLLAGQVLDMDSLPTLSDGTAGGMEANSITFELCEKYIDRFVTVSEDEIASAMRLIIEKHHMLVEGAAAVPVAAFLKDRELHAGKNVVMVLCGANVSVDVLRQVLGTTAAGTTALGATP